MKRESKSVLSGAAKKVCWEKVIGTGIDDFGAMNLIDTLDDDCLANILTFVPPWQIPEMEKGM